MIYNCFDVDKLYCILEEFKIVHNVNLMKNFNLSLNLHYELNSILNDL